MTPCCSSLSFIIHVHYRHLLIPIHVNDYFTTSLTFGYSRSPHLVHPIRPSVHTLTSSVSMRCRNDCPPFIIPLFPLSVGIHLSSHPLFVALFSSSRNCTVLYLLHVRWHIRLSSTTYLIDHNVTRSPMVRGLTHGDHREIFLPSLNSWT